MARFILPLAFLLALLALPSAAAGQAAPGDVVPDQYIVVLKPGALARLESEAVARAHGVQVLHLYEHVLQGFVFRGPAQVAQVLARNPNVQIVSEDRIVRAVAQSTPTGVRRIAADQNATARIDGVDQRVDVDVAVLDTGIDLDHPDLVVVGGKNCSRGSSYDDGNGHGTHVAGIIGALDNGQGVVGVAPGARLWAVRVLDNNGVGTWSSVICGIDWVTANAGTIEIANMSLGGGGSDDGNCGLSNNDVLHQAICRSVARGVVYVAAAGNNGVDAAGFVPAAYDEVVTVSALADYDGQPGGEGRATCANYGGDDTLASFSNYGADVDIAAPGACIRSTYRGGGYATMSGTSMASPHIAGVVALFLTATGANPENAEGVAAVRAAITNPANGYSVAQGDPRGFGGDRDAYPEPLAYVGAAASPLSVGGLAVAPDPFSPNGDGVKDAATISFNLSGAADWSVTVGDRTWSGSASGATTVSVTWDGTSGAGTRVADGAYTVQVNATSGSQTASATATVTVDTTPPTLSNLAATNVTSHSADVAWVTDEPSDSLVEYGTTSGSYAASTSAPSLVIDHAVALSGLSGGTTYYFRAISVDAAGNRATSAEQSFVTAEAPAAVMHVGDLDVDVDRLSRGRWRASVRVVVHNGSHASVRGATVYGRFAQGSWTRDVSCTTGSNGACSVSSGTFPSASDGASFTVTTVAHSTYSYVASANHDPDGDSNGTTITFAR